MMRRNDTIQELLEDVMASEVYLTNFASRPQTDYKLYQQSLMDFVVAWCNLKQNRHPSEFIPEMV